MPRINNEMVLIGHPLYAFHQTGRVLQCHTWKATFSTKTGNKSSGRQMTGPLFLHHQDPGTSTKIRAREPWQEAEFLTCSRRTTYTFPAALMRGSSTDCRAICFSRFIGYRQMPCIYSPTTGVVDCVKIRSQD